MKKKISLTRGKSIFIIDLILIPVFALVMHSGIKLHLVGKTNDHSVWEFWAHYHIVVIVLSLIFGGLHVKAHWPWYKSLIKRGLGRKSRVTVFLSLLFLVETITGIILVIFVDGGGSSFGMWHYAIGLLMALFLLIHLVSRFPLIIKGLRLRKKDHMSPKAIINRKSRHEKKPVSFAQKQPFSPSKKSVS